MMRRQLHPGELKQILRFGVVGTAASTAYLVSSLILLGVGIPPATVNVAAFATSLTLSYLGQYYFTYRASGAHKRLSRRYAITTLTLLAVCSALHWSLIWLKVSPPFASLTVTLIYPSLSFLFNHGWAFGRGRSTDADDGSPARHAN